MVVAVAAPAVAAVKEANAVMILISLYKNALTGSNRNITSVGWCAIEQNLTVKLRHAASS